MLQPDSHILHHHPGLRKSWTSVYRHMEGQAGSTKKQQQQYNSSTGFKSSPGAVGRNSSSSSSSSDGSDDGYHHHHKYQQQQQQGGRKAKLVGGAGVGYSKGAVHSAPGMLQKRGQGERRSSSSTGDGSGIAPRRLFQDEWQDHNQQQQHRQRYQRSSSSNSGSWSGSTGKAAVGKPLVNGDRGDGGAAGRRSTGEQSVLAGAPVGRRPTGELSRSGNAKARLEHLKQVQRRISTEREGRALHKGLSKDSNSSGGGGQGDSRRVSSSSNSSGCSVQAALDELPANIRRAMKRVSLN